MKYANLVVDLIDRCSPVARLMVFSTISMPYANLVHRCSPVARLMVFSTIRPSILVAGSISALLVITLMMSTFFPGLVVG